jgi:hypothetical protein
MHQHRYHEVIEQICSLGWQRLSSSEMVSVAWGYYHFSVQFRENLEIAVKLHPHDSKLLRLMAEECDTANLSPWPRVADLGERMNHDEYMRRTLTLSPVETAHSAALLGVGQSYLDAIRKLDASPRALSIASYEDGGLEQVFRAMLRYHFWDNELLLSFRHFLEEHIRFDSDPEEGHGALSRHMTPDDSVLPLWSAFKDVLVACAPRLAS